MPVIAKNKKAYHDFHILDEYEAGIVLFGTEVKSCRQGNVSLKEGFATIEEGEVFLHNVHISPYKEGNMQNVEPTRKRKLLLHKKQIRDIKKATEQKGMTMVPLSFYTTRGLIKVKLGLAKGKDLHDKREAMKKKESDRKIRNLITTS
jgi:SsrA-binding protein